MKPELYDISALANVLPFDHLVTLPGGPVEILMTSNPVNIQNSIEDIHDNYEFLIPITHFSHFFIDKRAVECRPGQLIIIKPHIRHGVSRSIQDMSFISVYVKADYLDHMIREIIGTTNAPFLCEQCLLHSEVQNVIATLINEMRDNRVGRAQLINNLSENLAIQLIRHYHISQLEEIRLFDKPLSEPQARFQNVLEYMHENLEDKLTIEKLADLSRMNRFHFIRAFKQAFGQSPYDFLTDLRITQAKRLLVHTRLSANDIGVQCGFFSASRFSAAFRQNTGITPSAYRTKMISEQRSLEHFPESMAAPYYSELAL
ncbi:MAG: helix-turn-helix transcriptional regulator [Eubacteriales bacterium]|nr:helix-turn-helix transcriptional regulator [Eubacteriales bacterium]